MNGWISIHSLPKHGLVLAACADGRMMIWDAGILADAMKDRMPSHLQFPATHWMHLPDPPKKEPAP